MRLATIGYEQDTMAGVIARLKRAGIKTLIDVRAVTSSRRPGFSKNALAASLDQVGIAYVHLRALGTPAAGREAARAGRIEEMRKIYERHLREPAAQAELTEAEKIAGERLACLLCYEADAACCHRAIVAARIKARTGCEVRDL
jgi:uncharacterized protein (DUF488 family)